jgi:hypothetical protein
MSDFVRHNACELRFVFRSLDQPGVYIRRSARQCEGIDARVVHDAECVWIPVGLRSTCEPAADVFDVPLNLGITDKGHLAFDLRGGLTSELNVLLLGKQVPAGFQFFVSCPTRYRKSYQEKRTL